MILHNLKRVVLIPILGTVIFGAAASEVNCIDSIYAPKIVGVPPSDAYIGLSLMPDGEIRHYNYGEQEANEASIYLSSRDNGFTWSEVRLSNNLPYADIKSPISGEYIRAFFANKKAYIIRTDGGLEGGRTISVLDEKLSIMHKPPLFADSGRVVVIGAHYVDRTGAFCYVSKDDGLTWQRSNQVQAPAHEIGGFDKGLRWNHGAVEPTIIELKGGKLWMIMRTARDRHYQSFSTDWGLTWSEPTPSPFYGTITMPTLFKLNDGRLLFFWSNTTPLPEVEGVNGVWEDVFTNRNAAHVAISEDNGETWSGFRELLLDERRNASDYATMAGIDKSVHQIQAVEIAPNKVLAAVGQHPLHRKMVIFDVDWVKEPSRTTNFADSLNSWSTFKYYKGIVGHCGYNRIDGGRLVNHPDIEGALALNIKYQPNDTLVQDNDGAVWNFPAAKSGEVTLRVMMPKESQKVDLVINDRWFNPTDTVAKHKGIYNIPLERKALKIKDDKWHNITVKWQDGKSAEVYVDKRRVLKTPVINKTLHGASYLHLISGKVQDDKGILIESVEAKSL